QTAHASPCLKRSPKAQKGCEGKGNENVVAGRDAGSLEDSDPVVDHPVPAFRSVQPTQGLPRRSTRLTEAVVAMQWVRQVGAIRWVITLILNQLFLLCKGHASRKLFETRESGYELGRSKFGRVKRIAV